MKKTIAASALFSLAFLAGCGSSSTTTTPVAGLVADGYLQNAVVFLDKNRNYQLDQGEPSTTTNDKGFYSLDVAPEDVGKYPIVAMAVKDQTVDLDTNLTVQSSYILCTPGTAVSGTVSNFISPMSTLIMEKMQANPDMTLTEAMAELRTQLGMPAGMDMMADYVAGGDSGGYRSQYTKMHQVAQQMATLMGEQAALVMGSNGAYGSRFRGMMGQIDTVMPQLAGGMDNATMDQLRTRMHGDLSAMPIITGFGNFSSMFRNMTGHNYFWNYSGGAIHPRNGMMGMLGV